MPLLGLLLALFSTATLAADAAAPKRPPDQVWSTREVNPNPPAAPGIVGTPPPVQPQILVVPPVGSPGSSTRPPVVVPARPGGVVDLRERP